MRNYKLLLATTAILSAALAMDTKADLSYNDSTDISVNVNIINAHGIIVVDDTIEFGDLAFTNDQHTATVTLDPDSGGRTITGSGVVATYDFDGEGLAAFNLNIPEGYAATITFPENILLDDTEGHEIEFTPSYTSAPTSPANGNYTEIGYIIGGSIDLTGETVPGGYQTSFEVTVVVAPQ